MANYQQNGGRNGALSEEDRQTWRPQDEQHSFRNRPDDDYRSWRNRNYGDSYGDSYRDDDRHDYPRSTERYGQGQSGYSAGRYGDDRSQQSQMQNRNDLGGNQADDRYGLGIDDRFTGRGPQSYWQDRSERGDRGYDPQRYGAQGGYGGHRGHESDRLGPRTWRPDERMGGGRDIDQSGSFNSRESVGYGYNAQQQTQRDDRSHAHRGTGVHRGKGPSSYQRSDERLREMICESLTEDDQIDATHIEVTVKNGEVTLTGTVEDRRTKREAEDCVASVSGVRDVQNQLRMRDEPLKTAAGRSSTIANGATAGEISDKKHRA